MTEPGRTCWRVERANRVAVIVDAACYFRMIKAAMLKAQHTIMLIGWDFDTRIRLDNTGENSDVPDTLGPFLTWLADRNPDLQIYILKWDVGALKTLVRGTTLFRMMQWTWHKRIHFKLDHAHPVGAAHHQKLAVIDDGIAFCGGIDMTADRWDTREHRDDDPRRRRPTTGRLYGPWHDATTAVDGNAARALGDYARDRWHRASGGALIPPETGSDPWPDDLAAHFETVDVAIARTVPAYDGRPEIREIESLYLAAIAAAQRAVYMESQYFASRAIAEAIAKRLREPDGPEIVVINPESAEGWLEEEAMGSARARLLSFVREADRFGRFRIYTPVTERGQPIYVHAKIMIVDEGLLRVGSSNLNNRSMGLDTECDLAIEASPDQSGVSRIIAELRHDLLAEHLGSDAEAVAKTWAETASLIRTIEQLRRPGRSLVPFEPPPLNGVEAFVAETDLFDPERQATTWAGLTRSPLLRALLPGARQEPAQPRTE